MAKFDFKRAWLPFLISLTLVMGIGIGLRLSNDSSSIIVPESNNTKLYELGRVEEVLRFIEAHYVDSIDLEKLKSAAIEGILSELDPHSVFISKELYPSLRDEMNGQFVGIGIIPRIIDNCVYIQRIREGSPADSLGVASGDILLAIEGDSVASNISYDSLYQQLNGMANSVVNLKFLRKDSSYSLSITRRKMKVSNVSAAIALNDSIGYIKIDRFAENTYGDFMQAIEKLQTEHTNELIIDIRGNTGGYLNETAKIISQFYLQKDIPIAWSDGLNTKRQEYKTTGKPFYQIKDIVILVDENSASASEILAGSVQDLSRGLVIGRRTFGKGLVQEQYNLSDGSAFRLTVAKYYLPSGRSIQRSYVNKRKYKDDWNERIGSGELLNFDSIPSLDSTIFYTQSGKIVRSKRGIVPDLYIPYNAIELEQNWQWLDYIIDDYVIKNLAQIKDSFHVSSNISSFEGVSWDTLKNRMIQAIKSDSPDMINYLTRIDSIATNEIIVEIKNSLCYSLFNDNDCARYKSNEDLFIKKAYGVLVSDSVNALLIPLPNN